MAEPRLGPEELDRLEDALEDLELRDDRVSRRDPSEAVSRRLADFKLILQASRDALPLEDVPAGLLDGVLAEARMSSEDIQTPATVPVKPGLWARFRKTWMIPGLAVAGSAALVLLLLQPTLRSNEPALAEAESVAVNDARPPATPAPSAAASAPGEQPEEDVQRAIVEESAPPPPASAIVAKSAESPSPQPTEPEAEPEPTPDLPARDEGWNAIEEGDKARKGGDCFTARNHYARGLDDGNDSVRARAYVGLGLCKREDGNEAAATEYFEQARELDEDALEFAGTQSKPKSKPTPRAARKKASGSKQKSAVDFEEAKDPFQ